MRLIDANKVVREILAERDKIPRTVSPAPYEPGTEKPYHAGDQMRGGIRKTLRCIEQAPTVDAVPVVRCRECKYRFKNNGHNKDGCPIIDANIWMDDDDFCSHGERKEGADNG